MLRGIVRAQVAFGAQWRLCAEDLQARVTELETIATVREVHMQEETARALAQERELWQRDRKPVLLPQREREQSQLQGELAMLHGYARVLIKELRALQAYFPPSPHMSSRGPIIPPGETEYMPAPPSPLGG